MDPSLTATELTEMLAANLPPGPAWVGAGVEGFVAGSAAELARLHNLIATLVAESDPCRCDALLEEWLAVAGLPDPCWQADPATDDEAKAALRAHITMRVGQRASAMEAHIQSTLGLDVEVLIGQHTSFLADISEADDELWDGDGSFVFDVEYPSATAADALRRLRCFVNRFKPAHCRANFVAV